jgi:phosphoribosyl-ATP pyrophosphohydrolase/phosphoribosyl-AMP cyclohydrolase
MNNFLDELVALISDRKTNPQAGSYTNRLLAEPLQAAQKVGEEATEVVIAALAQSDERLIEEMADLIYHSLVLLAARDIRWADVVATLEKRHRPTPR